MTAPSDAEEYDPKTGTFRPIRKPAPARRPPPRPAAGAARIAGLSETGQRYGVAFEVFEAPLKSNGAKYASWVSMAVIAVIFVLLLYEAISYRLSLG